MTVDDIRRNGLFLTYEQEYGLINLLSQRVKRAEKGKVSYAIKYKFYSLKDATYWRKITLLADGVAYTGRQEGKEMKQARMDILEQLEELKPDNE